MKEKEIKKYTLGILLEKVARKITGPNYVNELLRKIKKYNSNPKNPYFIGDIGVNEVEGVVTFKKYKKLTNMRTLKELDTLTLHYENEEELLKDLNISLDSTSPVVIMYRSNKTIRFIRVFYSKDKKYLDSHFVKTNFIENGKEVDFLDFLLSKKYFIKTAQNLDEIENLYKLKRAFVYSLLDNISLAPLLSFYDAFTTRNNKFNYFNFRMLGTLLRQYEISKNDLPELEEQEDAEPTCVKQNEEETTELIDQGIEKAESEISRLMKAIQKEGYTYKEGLQTLLYGYKLLLLQDIYKELKEGALDIDSNLEEELQKRLKLAHETTK